MIKNQIKQCTVDKTQIKITKLVIKKEKQDRCHTSLDQLRKILSEKSNRLLDVSIEKGVSNWLTALPISDFGFELSKQHFWDAYGMDEALQIYQQHVPVVVDLVYNTV